MRRTQGRGKAVGAFIDVIAQIAHCRLALTRQNHQRIGDIFAPRFEIGSIVYPVAQIIQRIAEGQIRHSMAPRLGPAEEIGDIGIQPQIAAGRIPQAERAAGILIAQHFGDRLIYPIADLIAPRQTHRGRHFVEVNQWKRA